VPAPTVCGIDFDNTLVSYDELLTTIARERGWIGAGPIATKRVIRDRIRRVPDGEIEWQKCQALLYGPRIGEARLSDGVEAFMRLCRQHGVQVHIISHKTEFSRFDSSGTNLRWAAMNWMMARGFFEPAGLGLDPRRVYFATTRAEKIAYIGQLSCTHFIDDLEETFLEETFPIATGRILYEPERRSPAPRGVVLMRTWQEICDYLFRAN
jgi:hypothetical protein